VHGLIIPRILFSDLLLKSLGLIFGVIEFRKAIRNFAAGNDELKALKLRDLPSYTIIAVLATTCIILNFFAVMFGKVFELLSGTEAWVGRRLEEFWDKLDAKHDGEDNA